MARDPRSVDSVARRVVLVARCKVLVAKYKVGGKARSWWQGAKLVAKHEVGCQKLIKWSDRGQCNKETTHYLD